MTKALLDSADDVDVDDAEEGEGGGVLVLLLLLPQLLLFSTIGAVSERN